VPASSENQLAELIAALPPAPAAWVQAAVALPAARVALDGLVAEALVHRERRARILTDLEGALREAGVTPTPSLVDRLRRELAEPV
jgi:hypothetical protein